MAKKSKSLELPPHHKDLQLSRLAVLSELIRETEQKIKRLEATKAGIEDSITKEEYHLAVLRAKAKQS